MTTDLLFSIYVVRTVGARAFDYRISRTQHALDELQKQRDETIEKLKVATRYTSTQQLLEKYGAESPKPSASPKAESEKPKATTPSQQQQPVARTGLPPPPTANIRRPPAASSAQPQPEAGSPPSPPPYQAPVQPQAFLNAHPSTPPMPQLPTDEPGFAPNAFPSQGQFIEQPHWYDRLLDVLLGEDEMQPRNRMAMICSSCRLVNGQAPPGIKTLEELGRWKCGSCGSWNGVESETTKILSTLRQNPSLSDDHEPASDASGRPKAEETVDDGTMTGSSEEGQQTSPQDLEKENVEEAQDEQPEQASKPEPARRSKRGKGGQSR